MKLTAFILAAGRGERLRPITDHIPKPLLPVLGRPVLESVLDKMSLISDRIGINLHYKKEEIADWISLSAFNKKVRLFPEEPVLGTGGALKNAEEFLKGGPFLVHNSDILSDIDLEDLINSHMSSGNLATLAVHDRPEFNKLILDKNGLLKEIVKGHRPLCTLSGGTRFSAFTGIAVYRPSFLEMLPAGASSVVDAWLMAASHGKKIGTFDVTGCYWTDIGTPLSYARTVFCGLKDDGETVHIDPSADVCLNAELDGYVVIEKECALSNRTYLRNCIVLPRTRIEVNKFENGVLGPGFRIDIDESDLFNTEKTAVLIGTGGSDRKYYRVRRNGRSAVLMQCTQGDPDFLRHIEYTGFFLKHSVPVPELIEVESETKRAVFEDLGDLSLYSWLRCPRRHEEIEAVYKRVLDILVLIHVTATKHISDCPLLRERVFDYDHLRWETGYFLERYVSFIENASVKDSDSLSEEFHRLAVHVDSFPKTIIHRDYQSQNIMITRGGIPRLLDYQGARIGPPAYDVASILWDPYYRLNDDLRESLLSYYIGKTGGKINSSEAVKFRKTILSCRLQRHMQALGAYGFLSDVKGKKYFRKYIPEGMRLLKKDLDAATGEYPVLTDLVKSIGGRPCAK
jgi:NDP-sugar pyrophosphorylase family protein